VAKFNVGPGGAVHPGEMLIEEFMKPLGLTAYQIAKDLDIQQTRISEIIKGKRSLTADTALRLGKYFNMSPDFWLRLQADYDLRMATASVDLKRVKVRPVAATA
jgi:antitoxin HigA-1